MKTPEEWIQLSGIFQRIPVSEITYAEMLVEDIQRDALSDPLTKVTDQQELEMLKDDLQKQASMILHYSNKAQTYKEKWHEARRYLRAANRGAERNNMVMRLQAQTISNILKETNNQ